MRAIVFVVALTLLAFQARPDLGTHSNPIANLDSLHLAADLYSVSDDFVTDAYWLQT